MSLDTDDEILQDFLVEAGEILESLSEQLVELEQRPDDTDLLNAIFRGFHTIKGGAGFLQLNALVDCCHVAENVFDVLRKHERTVTSDLMDTVLNALDTVNEMFDQVRQGEEPANASPDLLAALERLTYPEGDEPEESAADAASGEETAGEEDDDSEPDSDGADENDEPAVNAENGSPGDDITDDEFEQLLDALDESKKQGVAAAAQPTGAAGSEPASSDGQSDDGGDDEITDDEFEALLDQLHGEGQFDPSKTAAGEALKSIRNDAEDQQAGDQPGKSTEPEGKGGSAAGSDSDEITDDEFEALLDELHGRGQFDGGVAGKFDQESVRKAAESEEGADSEPVSDQPARNKTAQKGSAKSAASAASGQSGKSSGGGKGKGGKASAGSKPKPEAGPERKSADKAPAPAEKPAIQQETTVRVDTKRLDDIVNMMGELVLVRNRLVRLSEGAGDPEISKTVANLDVVTNDLQNSVMKTRMQPIKKVFGRFPRVVRDLARSLKKEINLELVGEDTDLDKNLVEALADPLVHLVRNSVDHGIEQPDVREQNGKPRIGKIILSAEQEGDHIMLAIRDDGGGMDADKLRSIAVKRGVMDQESADRLSDKEAYNLIFAPGFSTKTEITDVSGRGVGMDVVKTKIAQLNGFIDIESKMGEGTVIRIKVPLTLAIMPTLMVTLQEQTFALPLVNVDEIFHLDLTRTNVVDGREVVIVRGKPLPLFYLKRWLVRGAVTHGEESGHVVVVSVGSQKVGFVVDQLVGQEEVVIKPLGKSLHGTAGMAGATITGDGRIALILDVPSMLKEYA